MVTKEIKDILEGIHFFLTDGLKDESLSGKVECMRRGLLLQLEALRTAYPFLHFASTAETNANMRQTSTSLPYLHVEQPNANSCRMSTSSSSTNYSSTGGSNASSTGYSGDGVVTPPNQNVALIAEKQEHNNEEEEGEFEEIESPPKLRITAMTALATRLRRGSSDSFGRKDLQHDERDDDSYSDEIEPVPFRNLIGKCDHHGTLEKRTKSLLAKVRNHKSFLCVLSGHLLYLYHKEGDDKQKKVIDLNGYHVQEAPLEENKLNSRKRDFAFQLVSPGRKTHIFHTTKKSNLERWMCAIETAISGSGSIPLQEVKDDLNSPKYDDDDDADDDFYEELNPEEEAKRFLRVQSEVPSSDWTPPVGAANLRNTNPSQTNSDSSEYYSVPEDVDAIPTPKPAQKEASRVPPERPPLPEILRQQFLQRIRPLPEAPQTTPEVCSEVTSKVAEEEELDNPDDIYSEIDDAAPSSTTPLKEEVKADRVNAVNLSLNDFLDRSSSFSKEIFDTINERVPSRPAKTSVGHWEWIGDRKDVSADAESYDVPSDVGAFRPVSVANTAPPRAPTLPPRKRTPFEVDSDEEESEYKVPSSTTYTENIYQVPRSNPIPVECAPTKQIEELSSSGQAHKEEKTASSDNLNNNGDGSDENTQEEIETNPSSLSSSVNLVEPKPDPVSELGSSEKFSRKTSSTSVKDLIAKLNQNEKLASSSQSQLLGSPNNSFRESKSGLASDVGAGTVENKSKSAKAMETGVELTETVGDASQVQRQNDPGFSKSQTLKNSEETNGIPAVNGFHKESFSSNCGSQRKEPKTSQEYPGVFVAKFAFVSKREEDLSFNRGDEIVVRETPSDDRMWKGVLKGREGLVLKEYIRKKE